MLTRDGQSATEYASTDRPLLRALRGESSSPPPIWLMRQAGRYLPEYRALRSEKGNFLELCYDPVAAAEITLQPVRRFGFDGAILFSDILVVPHAMGQSLRFDGNEGPILSPPLNDATLNSLIPAMERLEPIYKAVRLVANALPPSTTLLGFAGAPWTVATYMVNGRGSRDHREARVLAYREPGRFDALIRAIERVTLEHLSRQIAAGALVIQLFDSWAGCLSPAQYERWVIAPTGRLVQDLRARHPETPIIGFPKGTGERISAYARETCVDAVGLDETIDPAWADSALPPGLPVQGNLDPVVLASGGAAMADAVERICRSFANRPHIFNLGHGITPDVPIANVEALIKLVRMR